MLANLRRWIVMRVIRWAEYDDVVTGRGIPLSELPSDSKGEVVKDEHYWGSISSVALNKPFMYEIDQFIKAKELWVRQAAYSSEPPEEMARRDAYFRGARSFRTMIDKANAQYQELTRGRNG